MDAVVYNRVSKLVPPEDRTSTDHQNRENESWCNANGHNVIQTFTDEGIGASRYSGKKRDEWEELKVFLRQRAQDSPDGLLLVCWEASRHSRDMAEFVVLRTMCEELGVKLAYKGRVFDFAVSDDRFMGGLDALIAERESAMIKERIVRGIKYAAMEGKPQGQPPWGYMLTGPRRWELDPIEAPRVREAAARLLDGQSQREVLEWLKATGYAPATASCLRQTMVNPAIAGIRIHRPRVNGKRGKEGKQYDGIWEPIITRQQHEQLVAQSQSRSYNAPGPEAKHLASGIAKCAVCKEGLQFRRYKHRTAQYICRRGHVSRLADMVDKAIETAVLYRLENVNPDDYDRTDPRLAEAEAEIEKLEADLAMWKTKAMTMEIDANFYAEVSRDRKRRIAELRPKPTPVEQELMRPERWPHASIKEQRDTVRRLLRIEFQQRGRSQGKITLADIAGEIHFI